MVPMKAPKCAKTQPSFVPHRNSIDVVSNHLTSSPTKLSIVLFFSFDSFTQTANGACVSEDKLCNGANDCGDYSDEQTCNVNECTRSIEKALCAHECEDRKVNSK